MATVDLILGIIRTVAGGIPVLIGLLLGAVPAALVLGVLGGAMAASQSRALRYLMSGYVYLFRSTPFLMLIFIAYYGLPYYGIQVSAMATAITALAIGHGAYMTEIVRGGLLGVDPGQREAARALGLTRFQTFRDVVLPQALIATIPSFLGQIILMIKETSLVSIIGISEMTKLGKEVVIRTNAPFLVFGLVGIMYYIICYSLEYGSRRLEIRLRKSSH